MLGNTLWSRIIFHTNTLQLLLLRICIDEQFVIDAMIIVMTHLFPAVHKFYFSKTFLWISFRKTIMFIYICQIAFDLCLFEK